MSCMASAPSDDDLFEEFLSQRGHDVNGQDWDENYNKKQCPDCAALHDTTATECTVCGWSPAATSLSN
jgi:hypothetical protein